MWKNPPSPSSVRSLSLSLSPPPHPHSYSSPHRKRQEHAKKDKSGGEAALAGEAGKAKAAKVGFGAELMGFFMGARERQREKRNTFFRCSHFLSYLLLTSVKLFFFSSFFRSDSPYYRTQEHKPKKMFIKVADQAAEGE